MGVNQPSTNANQKFLKQFSENFHFYKELEDKNFGFFQVYKNNTPINELQEYEYLFIGRSGKLSVTDDDISDKILSARKCIKLQHNNLLRVFAVTESSQEMLCGNMNKLNIYFEYYFHNLEVEIKERAKRKIYFEENELKTLLVSMVNGMVYLGANLVPQSNYIPSRVFLKYSGEIKTGTFFPWADNSLTPQQLQREFFAPEIMQRIRYPKQFKDYYSQNDEKSLIFSMGITLMQAASLKPLHLCFNFKQGTINFQFLWDLLNYLSSRYSRNLIKILARMIAKEKEVRPSATEIMQAMAEYEMHKVQLQPMQVSQIIPNLVFSNLEKSSMFSNQGLKLSQMSAIKTQRSSFMHQIQSPALFSPLGIKKIQPIESLSCSKQSIIVNRFKKQQFMTPQKYSAVSSYKKPMLILNQNQQIQQNYSVQPTYTQQAFNYNYSPIRIIKLKSISKITKTDENNKSMPEQVQYKDLSYEFKSIEFKKIDEKLKKLKEEKEQKKEKEKSIKSDKQSQNLNIEEKDITQQEEKEKNQLKQKEKEDEDDKEQTQENEKKDKEQIEENYQNIEQTEEKQSNQLKLEEKKDKEYYEQTEQIQKNQLKEEEEKYDKEEENYNNKDQEEIQSIQEEEKDDKKQTEEIDLNKLEKQKEAQSEQEQLEEEEKQSEQEEDKKQSQSNVLEVDEEQKLQEESKAVKEESEEHLLIDLEKQEQQEEEEEKMQELTNKEEKEKDDELFEKMSSDELESNEEDQYEKINMKILQAIKQSEETIMKLQNINLQEDQKLIPFEKSESLTEISKKFEEENLNVPYPKWPEEAEKGVSFTAIEQEPQGHYEVKQKKLNKAYK